MPDSTPKWLALAVSARQRRTREEVAQAVADAASVTLSEGCDLSEGALARIAKLSTGDRRHLANLRAHAETANLLRSGGAACTGLYRRRLRELEDGADEVGYALVKPRNSPLNRAVRHLLLHPPTPEIEDA